MLIVTRETPRVATHQGARTRVEIEGLGNPKPRASLLVFPKGKHGACFRASGFKGLWGGGGGAGEPQGFKASVLTKGLRLTANRSLSLFAKRLHCPNMA